VTRRQDDQLDAPAGQEGIEIDDQRIGPLALERRERCADLSTGASLDNPNIQAYGASCRSHVSDRGVGIGAGWVDEQRDALGSGQELSQDFQPLGCQFAAEQV
jgi:hypothetical protein